MEEEKCCCCHHKTKERSEKEYKDLIHRLNRIEGQIRGIKGMVEKDAYCPDILIQVAAANAALNSFNKVLLANHIRTCVAEDIRAGKDEVIDAAKMANVHHFIRTLPQGYNMVINEEGSNISQGEKQLLTIARAILKNPQIMILDEATSSVDTRLEKMLQSAMYTVLKDRTSFVIAHRLSTIKNADLILVLRDGDIAEMGNHESLMAQNGFYSQLYNSQFAWGAEEA